MSLHNRMQYMTVKYLSRQICIFCQTPLLPHSKTMTHAGFYKKQCFIYVILWKNNYIPFLKNTEDNEIKK